MGSLMWNGPADEDTTVQLVVRFDVRRIIAFHAPQRALRAGVALASAGLPAHVPISLLHLQQRDHARIDIFVD